MTLPRAMKIQIISTKNGLSVVRSLDVDGNCYGINATADLLYESFADPKNRLDIMNFKGSVLISVKNRQKTETTCFIHLNIFRVLRNIDYQSYTCLTFTKTLLQRCQGTRMKIGMD